MQKFQRPGVQHISIGWPVSESLAAMKLFFQEVRDTACALVPPQRPCAPFSRLAAHLIII
ncbi:hypothetical protein CY658_02930 [Variovorax sp. RO1]|nr:hypothetical protein CY658_02930 [Variovorax sp. RO1]